MRLPEYRCQLQANHSLSDLQLRIVNGKETAKFSEIEKPKFAIEAGPAWLMIDPATGMLSGTPDAAGTVHAVTGKCESWTKTDSAGASKR